MKGKALVLCALVVLFAFGGRLADVDPPASASNLQGKIAYIGTDGNIWTVNPDGSNLQQLTTDAFEQYEQSEGSLNETYIRYEFFNAFWQRPKWSPDGTKLAYFRSYGQSGPNVVDESTVEFFVTDLKTPAKKIHTLFSTSGIQIVPTAWAADSRGIYFEECLGESYVMPSDCRINLVDTNSGEVSTIFTIDEDYFATIINPSPDGRYIAWHKGRVEGVGIPCIYDLETGENYCHNKGMGFSSWSPDGSKLVIDNCSYGCAEGYMEIFDPVDLSSVPLIYTSEKIGRYNPVWSPTGDKIAYKESICESDIGPCTESSLWGINPDGGKPTKIADSPSGYVYSFSADGSQIVYAKRTESTTEWGDYEIWVTKVDGSSAWKIGEGNSPIWQPTTFCDQPPSCEQAPNGLNLCDLQVGDILLSHNLGGMYVLLNTLFQGYWTHAAIYNGCGLITESFGSLTCENWPQDWACLSDEPGVEIKNIKESGFWTAPDWAILRPNLGDSEKQAAVIYAADQDPKKYNWNYLDKWTESKFYCSQLVWRAYEKQGINLDSNLAALKALTKWIGPWGVADAAGVIAAVPPDDIYYDSDVRLIKERPGLAAALRRTIFRILSPAHLYVTDPQGRHTGVDPTSGQVVEEIPGVFYSGPDVELEFISVQDLAGNWEIQVVGTGDGTYTLQAENVDSENHAVTKVVGETNEGLTRTYETTHLDAGWNSKCYVGEQKSVEEALAGIRESLAAVYQLKPDQTFARYIPDRPEISTLSAIDSYTQLFILTSTPTNWLQERSSTNPTNHELAEGWNGFCYSGSTKPTADALSSISQKIAAVYKLGDGQTWSRYIPDRPEISNLTQLARSDAVLMLVTK